jgi:hypothetical protein
MCKTCLFALNCCISFDFIDLISHFIHNKDKDFRQCLFFQSALESATHFHTFLCVARCVQAAVDTQTGGSYVMTQKWVQTVRTTTASEERHLNEWVDKAWEEAAGRPAERKFQSLLSQGEGAGKIPADEWMDAAYEQCQRDKVHSTPLTTHSLIHKTR